LVHWLGELKCHDAELLCALDVSARHTSSRITFLTLTIVGRSRGNVGSHQGIFQTFGFPESQDGWVNARIVVTPLFQMTFQFPKPFLVVCSLV
jgi:hypothetical protein